MTTYLVHFFWWKGNMATVMLEMFKDFLWVYMMCLLSNSVFLRTKTNFRLTVQHFYGYIRHFTFLWTKNTQAINLQSWVHKNLNSHHINVLHIMLHSDREHIWPYKTYIKCLTYSKSFSSNVYTKEQAMTLR